MRHDLWRTGYPTRPFFAACLLGSLAPLACPQSVQAQTATVAYSNVTNFSGSAFANGGAPTTGTPLTTRMVADDITLALGFGGGQVTAFQFSVANLNTTAQSARPIVSFYAGNGTSGGPGTLLSTIPLNPVTVAAASATLVTFNPGTTIFTAPTSGFFWAGLSFDNSGGSTAVTAALLNNFGQGVFNPPTIGTSGDSFFLSTNAGVGSTNNPTGTFSSFSGNPVANFGWSFTVIPVATAAPEPGTLILLALGTLVGSLVARRRV